MRNCLKTMHHLDCYPALRFQDHCFSPSGHATGRSPTAIIRHELVTPSFALLAPPISSPCSDANGGIDLLEIGSAV